jgi:A/G-specific adenine glycosylase
MQIVFDILNWYKKNSRILPWRTTKDPYKIWLSEVILQQTQVVQGLNYYERFLENFYDIFSLAKASEEEILKNWQGLGYYSRARNLHKTAKIISETYNGKFPESYNEIIKLPGIGPYTAAAILSIAFEKKHPVLDGNVYRFISRLYAIELAIDEAKNRFVFLNILVEMMKNHQASLFNNAMMEMGAVVCKPQNPDCINCPVQSYCEAKKQNTIQNFPVKTKKLKIKNRYLNYFFVEMGDSFLIQKRTKNDIWQNLYELPLIESGQELSLKEIKKSIIELIQINKNIEISPVTKIQHILTHQRLHVNLWRFKINELHTENLGIYIITNFQDFKKYPIPKLIEKILLHL